MKKYQMQDRQRQASSSPRAFSNHCCLSQYTSARSRTVSPEVGGIPYPRIPCHTPLIPSPTGLLETSNSASANCSLPLGRGLYTQNGSLGSFVGVLLIKLMFH